MLRSSLMLRLGLLLLLAAGCSRPPSVLVRVSLPEAEAPTQLRFTVTLEGEPLPPTVRPQTEGPALGSEQTVRLVLPERAVGKTLQVLVEGLKGGSVVGRAEGGLDVRRGGEEQVLSLTLSPSSACSAETCPDGCCVDGVCTTASVTACGKAGACQACSTTSADRCVDGACRCGSEAACGPGFKCVEGQCVCDGQCECSGNEGCTTPPGQCSLDQGACAGGACSYTTVDAGTACSDGDSCTDGDACNGSGQCAGTPKACTTPPGQCYDTAGACASGACTYPALSQDNPCDDGDNCTTSDHCDGAGGCSGTRLTCNSPPGQCYTWKGTCSNGSCDYTPRPQGDGCDDGNPCTINDTCDGSGVCQGMLKTCDTPPGECYESSGTCQPSTGQCTYPPKQQGTTCGGGWQACSRDTCNGAGSCVTTTSSNGSPCGNCGSCSSGVCSGDCDESLYCCGTGSSRYCSRWACSEQP